MIGPIDPGALASVKGGVFTERDWLLLFGYPTRKASRCVYGSGLAATLDRGREYRTED